MTIAEDYSDLMLRILDYEGATEFVRLCAIRVKVNRKYVSTGTGNYFSVRLSIELYVLGIALLLPEALDQNY